VADIFNDQRVVGVVFVPDGTTMYNGRPVVGCYAVNDGVFFIDNQRVVKGVEITDGSVIYNDQPVIGVVDIQDGRKLYNNQLVTPLGRVNADFPYPTFPYTTLMQMQTASDLAASSGSNTIADTAHADSPYNGTAVQITSVGFASSFTGKPTAAGVNVQNGSIRFNYKPIANCQRGGTSPSSFTIRLFSTTSPGANYHQAGNASWLVGLSTEPTAGTPGRWQTAAIPINRFTAVGTGADLSSIRCVQFIVTFGNGAVYCLGNVDFVPNPRSKAALIFAFDDATLSAKTAQAILDPYGLAGVIYPGAVASAQGINGSGKLTTADVQSLVASGWQFASQSYSTESNTIVDAWTRAERLAEYAATRNYTRSPFNRYRDSYDGSYYSSVSAVDMTAWPELRDSFRTLRRFDNGNPVNPPLPYGECFPFGDPKNIVCLNQAQNGAGGGADTTLYTGYAMDQVIASKGVLIAGHHNDLTNPNVLDAFNYAVTRATTTDAANIEIITLRKLLAPYNGDTLTG